MGRIRAKAAAIWNYFQDIDNADGKALCKYCKNAFSYKSTITNLKFHLQKKHIDVYKEFCLTEKKTLRENAANVYSGHIVLAVGERNQEGNEELTSGGGGSNLEHSDNSSSDNGEQATEPEPHIIEKPKPVIQRRSVKRVKPEPEIELVDDFYFVETGSGSLDKEYEAIGANVVCKLKRMSLQQRCHAELLINKVLIYGLQNNLTGDTDLTEVYTS